MFKQFCGWNWVTHVGGRHVYCGEGYAEKSMGPRGKEGSTFSLFTFWRTFNYLNTLILLKVYFKTWRDCTWSLFPTYLISFAWQFSAKSVIFSLLIDISTYWLVTVIPILWDVPIISKQKRTLRHFKGYSATMIKT